MISSTVCADNVRENKTAETAMNVNRRMQRLL